MDGFDCFYILDEPPNCYISPKDLGREWNKNKVSGWKSCAPAPQEKGGWHLEQRERSHKAHSRPARLNHTSNQTSFHNAHWYVVVSSFSVLVLHHSQRF